MNAQNITVVYKWSALPGKLAELAAAAERRNEGLDHIWMAQLLHEWHKAVVHVQSENQKLQQMNIALGAAFSYFTEASDELAKANTFSAWKHEILDKRRLVEVRRGLWLRVRKLRWVVLGKFAFCARPKPLRFGVL